MLANVDTWVFIALSALAIMGFKKGFVDPFIIFVRSRRRGGEGVPKIERTEPETPRPLLVFGEAYVEPWDMNKILLVPEGPAVNSTTSVSVSSTSVITTSAPEGTFELVHPIPLGEYDIAFVDISAEGIEKVKGVTAKPEFYRTDGSRIKHTRIFSRWWEKTERPVKGETYRDLRRIDIEEANPALLVFAFTPKNDRSMYAYDHTAHSEHVDELKKKGTELGFSPIIAKLSVQGSPGIGPLSGWFRLKLSQSGGLTVANIPPPDWADEVHNDKR